MQVFWLAGGILFVARLLLLDRVVRRLLATRGRAAAPETPAPPAASRYGRRALLLEVLGGLTYLALPVPVLADEVGRGCFLLGVWFVLGLAAQLAAWTALRSGERPHPAGWSALVGLECYFIPLALLMLVLLTSETLGLLHGQAVDVTLLALGWPITGVALLLLGATGLSAAQVLREKFDAFGAGGVETYIAVLGILGLIFFAAAFFSVPIT